MIKRHVIAAICFCSLTATAKADWLLPGDHRIEFTHQSLTRSYLLHIPPSNQVSPLPVVLNFHGGGGNAQGQEEFSMMNAFADTHHFIVVYPNGTGPFRERLLTWNAGDCCGYAKKHNIDDVGFVRALLWDLKKRSNIDARRVYATGLSNGAMMTYELARKLRDTIAAFAPVAGSPAYDSPAGAPAVPVLHIHSVDDPRALYTGGLGPPFPLTNTRVMHRAVENSLKKWALNNGCSPTMKVVKTVGESVPNSGSSHRATLYEFEGCPAKAPVMLWKMEGPGHVWPGGLPNYKKFLLGPSTHVIDANEEMWKFFERFSLQAITP